MAVSTRLGPRVTGAAAATGYWRGGTAPTAELLRTANASTTDPGPICGQRSTTDTISGRTARCAAGGFRAHARRRAGREPAGNGRAGDDVAHPTVSPKASWTPTMAATWSASACGPRRCSTRSPRPALTRGSSSCARAEVSSSRMLATNCPPPAAREAATSTTQPVDIVSQASWRPGLSARPRAHRPF